MSDIKEFQKLSDEFRMSMICLAVALLSLAAARKGVR